MVKTHKIALVHTPTQTRLFSQHCGYARVAYNHALNAFKAALDTGVFKWLYTLKRAFNAVKLVQYEWSGELCQNASKNAIRALDKAIKNLRNKKLRARLALHRKRSGKRAFQADNGKGTVKVDGKKVFLPKIGWVKMAEQVAVPRRDCQGHRDQDARQKVCLLVCGYRTRDAR